jgi:hypothetical protein
LEDDVVDGLAPLLSDALKSNTVDTLIENMDQLAVSKERQVTAMFSSDAFGSIDKSAKKLTVVGAQLSKIRDTVTTASHSIQKSGSKVIAAKTSYRTARSAYDNINAEAALSQSLEVLKSTDSAQELIQKKKKVCCS